MKMEAVYLQSLNAVDLQFDAQARKVLNVAAEAVASFCGGPGFSELTEAVGEPLAQQIASGARLLEYVATSPACPVRIVLEGPLDMIHAASLTCMYLLESGRTVSPFEEVIILLAKMTPLPVLTFPLPPAAEVLDRSIISEEVWNNFETIRCWKQSQPPHLFLIDLHSLLIALSPLYQPGNSLGMFIEFLEAVTGIFRFTMEELAKAELTKGKKTKSKSRRKK